MPERRKSATQTHGTGPNETCALLPPPWAMVYLKPCILELYLKCLRVIPEMNLTKYKEEKRWSKLH